jgi:beta-glucosidase/6-phospho-beta-glucosidase/beta-galactosidase
MSVLRLLDCLGANYFTIYMLIRLSEGTLEGGINHKGIEYYKKLINLLKENGYIPDSIHFCSYI